MDQFSRGIFYMPHPEHEQQLSKSSLSSCPSSSKPKSSKEDLNFSRAKDLYTLAPEVLLVSEKLPQTSERRYWANWADSIFNQMQMEKGGARASERGEEGKCHSPPSSKPRATEMGKGKGKGPAMSLPTPPTVPSIPMYTPITTPSGASPNSYFSPLQPPPSTVSSDEDEEEEDAKGDESEEEDELGDLLAEALLTLANLTKDKKKREELYARAEKESEGKLSLGGMRRRWSLAGLSSFFRFRSPYIGTLLFLLLASCFGLIAFVLSFAFFTRFCFSCFFLHAHILVFAKYEVYISSQIAVLIYIPQGSTCNINVIPTESE
ncbi:hypothetical protein PQX77_018164 [Marasmius sp. AFHP31]|nr:hypothetical protein PQX77_018164 [Marasmius sp. AFHP31]